MLVVTPRSRHNPSNRRTPILLLRCRDSRAGSLWGWVIDQRNSLLDRLIPLWMVGEAGRWLFSG